MQCGHYKKEGASGFHKGSSVAEYFGNLWFLTVGSTQAFLHFSLTISSAVCHLPFQPKRNSSLFQFSFLLLFLFCLSSATLSSPFFSSQAAVVRNTQSEANYYCETSELGKSPKVNSLPLLLLKQVENAATEKGLFFFFRKKSSFSPYSFPMPLIILPYHLQAKQLK